MHALLGHIHSAPRAMLTHHMVRVPSLTWTFESVRAL